jgi:hypothetical protein
MGRRRAAIEVLRRGAPLRLTPINARIARRPLRQ